MVVTMRLVEGVMHGVPRPIWKKGKGSLVLVASNGSCHGNIVLCSIGADIEYLEEGMTLDEWFDGIELHHGIWVVTVGAQGVTYATDYGDEHDVEFDVIDIHVATNEEIKAHREDEWPWDPNEWMENWPEIRDYRFDVRCIGDGSDGAGCGHEGGVSGSTCPSCGGMMLSQQSIDQADAIQEAWGNKGDVHA